MDLTWWGATGLTLSQDAGCAGQDHPQVVHRDGEVCHGLGAAVQLSSNFSFVLDLYHSWLKCVVGLTRGQLVDNVTM